MLSVNPATKQSPVRLCFFILKGACFEPLRFDFVPRITALRCARIILANQG
jgi:hypothetical protein